MGSSPKENFGFEESFDLAKCLQYIKCLIYSICAHSKMSNHLIWKPWLDQGLSCLFLISLQLEQLTKKTVLYNYKRTKTTWSSRNYSMFNFGCIKMVLAKLCCLVKWCLKRMLCRIKTKALYQGFLIRNNSQTTESNLMKCW